MSDIVFKNGKEMLHTIWGGDLYNVETGDYVFEYNNCGSICVYNLSEEEAIELQVKSKLDGGQYWGAYLGPGGYIYDDPSYEGYDKDYSISNLEWCKENFSEPGWVYCQDVLEVLLNGNIV